MSPAILPQHSTAVSAGGGSAPSMPRMRPGTPAPSNRVTKGAKVRFRFRRLTPNIHQKKSLGLDFRAQRRSATDPSANCGYYHSQPELQLLLVTNHLTS